MNSNVLQRAKEFDYTFVSRLLFEVFDTATLCESTAASPNMKKTAYARLDDSKYAFIEEIFKERLRGGLNEKARFEDLPKLVNKRCAALRAKNHPVKKVEKRRSTT